MCEGYTKDAWIINYAAPTEKDASESTPAQHEIVAPKLHFLPVNTKHSTLFPLGKEPLLLLEPTNPYATIEELRAFKYYSERSVPILSRFSDNDPALWTTVIPQLAWSSVAVRQSLIAMALVFEAMGRTFLKDAGIRSVSLQEQLRPPMTMHEARLSIAYTHISKAIQSLISDDATVEVVLTAGFLLRFVETLGHNAVVARMHLLHTIKVLQGYQRNVACGLGTGATDSQRDLIATYLEPAIKRAARHAKKTLTHPDGIARPLIDDPNSSLGAEIRREVRGRDV